MTKTATKKDSIDCINAALFILGDKWTPLLIKELSSCPRMFSDLEKNLIGISPRTLSQRLEKLVKNRIITKSIYCEHPPRYQYSLTDKGNDLKKILRDMSDWSQRYSQDNSTIL